MAATQKALVLTKKFGSFEVTTVLRPSPGPNEVLVKQEAVALNPIDWKIQKYGLFIEYFPAILGSDSAGEVVELGEGVTGFSVGDKVLFQAGPSPDNSTAAYQQYVRVDALTVAKIPSNLTIVQAATIPATLTTAVVGLYNNFPHGFGLSKPFEASGREKYSGQPFVVLGGSGSVGQTVLRLASVSGFSPVIATSSLKHADYLKSLGATHVIDRNLPAEEIKAAVKDVLGSTPVTKVFDAVSGADTQQLGFDLLAPGGQIALVLPATTEPTDGKQVINVSGVKGVPQNAALIQELYTHLTQLLADGIVKPHPSETLPDGLSGIIGGLERLSQNGVSGIKLVALPQETA